MVYDYSKLLGKIKEVCGSQAVFAALIGLSERTTSLKLNNKKEWKQSEMENSCEVLKIDRNKIPIYFFVAKVQKLE